MVTPLKTERLEKGISTSDLAAAVGVAAPTINRIENGVMRPSPELANRIAKFFSNHPTRDQILFPEDYVETPVKPSSRKLKKAS